MSIKKTNTYLVTGSRIHDIETYILTLLQKHVTFELLRYNDIHTKESVHVVEHKPQELSKREKALREKVAHIVDAQLALRKDPLFEDRRDIISVDEFASHDLSYESVYKREKRVREEAIVDLNDLHVLKAYLSKLEFYEKMSELVSYAFSFKTSPSSEPSLYLAIAVTPQYDKEVRDIAQECDMLITSVSWPQTISLWQSNRLFSPFQRLAGDLGSVSSRDLDMSWLIGLFFVIFFGFSLGDALYGLILVLVTGFLWFGVKVKPSMLSMIKLFFYSGIGAMIVGALTGSWGGDLISAKEGGVLSSVGLSDFPLFSWLRSLQIIEPIDAQADFVVNTSLRTVNINPIVALLGFAIFIGIACVVSGYVINAINLYRNNHIAEGNKEVVWLFFLASTTLYFLAPLTQDTVSVYFATGVLIIALLCVFLINEGKGFAGKLIAGFGTLYNSISFLADALSFTRIVAVGLTGAVIGSVMNLLGTLLFNSIQIPVLNVVLLLAILAGGHIFNFVISLFGAYINPLRLSYVEYLPKFILSHERNMMPEKISLTHHILPFEK